MDGNYEERNWTWRAFWMVNDRMKAMPAGMPQFKRLLRIQGWLVRRIERQLRGER